MILAHMEDCIREDQKVNEQRYELYKQKRQRFDSLGEAEKELQRVLFYEKLQDIQVDPVTDLKILYIPDTYTFEFTSGK